MRVHIDLGEHGLDIGGRERHTVPHDAALRLRVPDRGRRPAVAVAVPMRRLRRRFGYDPQPK